MEIISIVGVGIFSALVSGTSVFLWARARFAQVQAEVRAELEPERAVLLERVQVKDAEIAKLTEAWEIAEQNRDEEASLRAMAEERSRQIPDLQELVQRREDELRQLQQKIVSLTSNCSELRTGLEKERRAFEEKITLYEQAEQKLSDAFKALSSDALRSNNQSFLELAQSTLEKFNETARGDLDKRQTAIDQLVKPVRESLEKFDLKVQELEQKRSGAYEGLSQQVRGLMDLQQQLRSETSNLVRALGAPKVRGRWGEVQLKRVVEMAGMLDYCDFKEQTSVSSDEGIFRPDLIVHLPSGKQIIVDAKAPLAAYLEAIEAEDEVTRKAKLIDHARQVRAHITALSGKAYWNQFQPTPEFVVLFIPGEAFYSAALEYDPALMEEGIKAQVLVASPMTLIALLRAVAYGWRQESLAKNAEKISDLGKEIYKRLAGLSENFQDVGLKLGKAVDSYNNAVGSLETRVLVSARRFRDLEAHGGEAEIEIIKSVDTTPRKLQAPELLLTPSETKASVLPQS